MTVAGSPFSVRCLPTRYARDAGTRAGSRTALEPRIGNLNREVDQAPDGRQKDDDVDPKKISATYRVHDRGRDEREDDPTDGGVEKTEQISQKTCRSHGRGNVGG